MSIHVGAGFKGMTVKDRDDFVEFQMDNRDGDYRDYVFIDRDEAILIVRHLIDQFDIEALEVEHNDQTIKNQTRHQADD